VYLAVSQRGKEAALKLVQRHLDIELRGVRQCLNLKHPHLVVVHDILKVENDDYWIVMEFVAGESLADLLARHPQGMPEQEILVWLRGICAGVAYLHDHGIAHRDLKPGNLFIEKGVVKIGDYGLAKFLLASQGSGHTEGVGTVHYMAPEMSRGRYGKQVDQYALGVILYQMLTGRLPFDGESPGEILMKHLVGEPDLTGLAEPYRSVVARLLDKDPQRRFPSVGEALNQLLEPIPAAAQAGSEPAPTQSYHGSDPEQSQEADPDRADLVQILVENGITEPEEIAQVFQTLGEGSEQDWLARARAVRMLAEYGQQASDIIALLDALPKRPGQDLAPRIQALQILLDHGIEDRDDIGRVLRALDASAGKELSGNVTALQILVENGIEGSETIERILEALGEYPTFDLSSKLTVLRLLAENGIDDSADIARVLSALARCPAPNLASKVRAVRSMASEGMEVGDIERLIQAH
jgi:hypothetical protein